MIKSNAVEYDIEEKPLTFWIDGAWHEQIFFCPFCGKDLAKLEKENKEK